MLLKQSTTTCLMASHPPNSSWESPYTGDHSRTPMGLAHLSVVSVLEAGRRVHTTTERCLFLGPLSLKMSRTERHVGDISMSTPSQY